VSAILLLAALACDRDPGEAPSVWLAPDAPAPLRRMNGDQLNRTFTDLFRGFSSGGPTPGIDIPWQRFPVDPRVGGFDNNADGQVPSTLLVEDVQRAAVNVTAAAMAAPTFLPCEADGGDDPVGCGRAWLSDFGRRAFRRPLTEAESESFLGFFEQQQAETGDFRVAVQLGMQAFLNSPEFLYFFEFGADGGDGERVPLDPYELASRMSYFLWGTMPDEALLEAAASGRLADADGVEGEAWRMLEDARAREGVLTFHRLWLDLDEIDAVWVHYDRYPTWTAEMNPAMRAELEQQVLRVWDGPGTLPALLLDRETEIDPLLAVVYGLPEGATELPAGERAGVLTRAGWLAAKAHMVQPSPVARGVWVLDRLLCAPPPPPPPDVDTSIDVILGDPTIPNRAQYEAHEANPACASCHTSIDGVGFGFEHYDAMGAWRDVDAGQPVDATGSVVLDGATVAYDGATALSELLAASEDAQRCYARQWYRYALGRLETEADGLVLAAVEGAMLGSGGDLRDGIVAILRSETFRTRPAP
jgi:hypothetical protein